MKHSNKSENHAVLPQSRYPTFFDPSSDSPRIMATFYPKTKTYLQRKAAGLQHPVKLCKQGFKLSRYGRVKDSLFNPVCLLELSN